MSAAAGAGLGREIQTVGKAEGTRRQLRGKPKGHGSSGGAIVSPPDEKAPTLKELNNPLDQGGWAVERFALFVQVLVTVINTANTGHDVP